MRRVRASIISVGAIVGVAGVFGAVAVPASVARSAVGAARTAQSLPPISGRTSTGAWFHRTRTHQEALEARASASPLDYGGGPVMLSTVTYAILWEPAHLQSGTVTHVPSNYNSLLDRFFADVGGHGLYTDMTQYYEVTGGVKHYVQNSSAFGGAIVDTDAYPKASAQCAEESNCLGQAQLQTEIQHEMSVHGWTGGLVHTFFIFTLPGEDSVTPRAARTTRQRGTPDALQRGGIGHPADLQRVALRDGGLLQLPGVEQHAAALAQRQPVDRRPDKRGHPRGRWSR